MSIPSSGSSTWRSASTRASFVGMRPVYRRLDPRQSHFLAPLAGEEVDAVDEAHPVAAGAHDERVRRGAVGEKADAAQEIAVGDSGSGHDHVAGREVVDAEDAGDVVDAVLAGRLDLAP